MLLVAGLAVGFLAAWLIASEREPEAVASGAGVADTPAVITAVRELARLETTTYHVERVIDLRNRQTRLFGMMEVDDAILLVAAGDVTAGVDLAALAPEDIDVDPAQARVRVVLPPPEILSARLDNELSYVYERETDLLARRVPDLETRARQEAERTLRQAALDGGILGRARRAADKNLRALLTSLGFRDVEIAWSAPSPPG